jgi:hypothetical protein
MSAAVKPVGGVLKVKVSVAVSPLLSATSLLVMSSDGSGGVDGDRGHRAGAAVVAGGVAVAVGLDLHRAGDAALAGGRGVGGGVHQRIGGGRQPLMVPPVTVSDAA